MENAGHFYIALKCLIQETIVIVVCYCLLVGGGGGGCLLLLLIVVGYLLLLVLVVCWCLLLLCHRRRRRPPIFVTLGGQLSRCGRHLKASTTGLYSFCNILSVPTLSKPTILCRPMSEPRLWQSITTRGQQQYSGMNSFTRPGKEGDNGHRQTCPQLVIRQHGRAMLAETTGASEVVFWGYSLSECVSSWIIHHHYCWIINHNYIYICGKEK